MSQKNFLTTVKLHLHNSPQGMRAPQGYSLVPDNALEELVHHFERLDQDARVESRKDVENTMRHRLYNLIRQMWFHNGKNAEEIMFEFADALKELTQEKEDERPRNIPFMKREPIHRAIKK